MQLTFFDMASLVIAVAAVFGYINYRTLKLPFAIGITVAALIASCGILALDMLIPSVNVAETTSAMLHELNLTRVLMNGMLSFLLFAGSLHVDMDDLKAHKLPILVLATLGVLISTAIVGLGSYGLFGLLGIDVPLSYCLVFGSLIAPTDPVAVLGIMRAAGAAKAHEVKVVGESLFNDGIGVVVFTVLLAFAVGGDPNAAAEGAHHAPMGAAGVLQLLGQEVIGGIGLGLIGGYATYRAMKDMDEPNLEILFSIALVMGITVVALRLHFSAPLACVAAGLFIGNHGRDFAMSGKTQQALDLVWHFIDELLNAVLFLLVGLEVVVISREITGGNYLLGALLMIPLALGARLISVAIPVMSLRRYHGFTPGATAILTWGGLKGGISVALALSLPEFNGRGAIVAATYLIVIFSIVVQGLTVGKLIERLKRKIPIEDQAPPAEGAH